MLLEFFEYRKNSEQPAQQLVIMLHGYGSHGRDLLSIAPELANFLPNAHFISPHAPTPVENGGDGFQWFSLENRNEESMLQAARYAGLILNDFIDQQLERFHLQSHQLALMGFSQGAMMSLYAALRREEKIAGVVAYSGMLLGANTLHDEILSKPPVMLVHGMEDQVVVPELMMMAESTLHNLGVGCHTVACNRLGHGIDQKGVVAGGKFLAYAFKEQPFEELKYLTM